jgi:hypothetical protein
MAQKINIQQRIFELLLVPVNVAADRETASTASIKKPGRWRESDCGVHSPFRKKDESRSRWSVLSIQNKLHRSPVCIAPSPITITFTRAVARGQRKSKGRDCKPLQRREELSGNPHLGNMPMFRRLPFDHAGIAMRLCGRPTTPGDATRKQLD